MENHSSSQPKVTMDKFIFDMERRNSEAAVEQTHVVETINHSQDVLSMLDAFRQECAFTDVILCVGKSEFPCHRNVMAVSSPYFKAMFSSDLRESKEYRINFNDMNASILKQIIEFAYTGRVEITVDNAQGLLAAGTLFQYPPIVKGCCEFLRTQLHPCNCLGIEEFAQMHSCSTLESDAHCFAMENFSAVVEYDEFLDLPLERLLTYLASDLIDVRTEETVYDAAMKWVQSNIKSRLIHLNTVLETVRFVAVDVQYLEEVIEKDSLIKANEQCLKLIRIAKEFHETNTRSHEVRRRSMQIETMTPRPSTMAKEVMVLIGGINREFSTVLRTVEMYDPNKDKFYPLPDLPVTISWYSVSSLCNGIYVTGGFVDSKIVADVWKFDANKCTWSKVAPMLEPRTRHASTTWNGDLYVLGGVNLNPKDGKLVVIESIERYNVEKNIWSTVGYSPMPRKLSQVVPYKHNLVEVGGMQNGIKVKTLESYTCSETEVKYTGEQYVLPDPIQYSQIVVLNGIFYIIWEESKKFISLNPDRRTFHRLADMHYAHMHSGATVLGGKIYICGGLLDSKPSRIIECYDPATNSWTLVKSMKEAKACHGCVTISM